MRIGNKIKKPNRHWSFLGCLILLFALLFSTTAFAETNEPKTVRIGWYHTEHFQEGMSDEEYKSGYSYEYIHHIADYNGWSYEYVYGEWADLFAKLKSGEIDLLAGVSKTEERMDYFLYPDEIMGNEHYVLYQHSADKSMDAGDVKTFTGKKIGAIRDNLMTTCLENWLEKNGAQAELVYYNGFEERDRDFDEDKIDAVVGTDNNVLLSDGYSQIVTVGKESYYLAVSKKRSDLLADLNRAQAYIQDIDPYYLTNLEYQCYGTTLANSTLSAPEEAWVDAHSVLTVGYLDNYIPYCATDQNGNAYGVITDVMNSMLQELSLESRLSIAYKGYASGDEMIEALKNGEIDAAFPVGGENWQLEQKGIKATNDLVTSGVNLVYKGTYSFEKIKKLAVTKGNTMMRDYLSVAYPDAEIIEYPSIKHCMEAVMKGEVDATSINGLRVDLVKRNRSYNALSLMQMDRTSGRCLGVATGNTGLLMLLNRGIKLIGTNFASNASYNYMEDLYQVTVGDFIAGHLELAIEIVGLIILIILLAAIKLQNKTKEFLKVEEEKNRQLQEHQEMLEEAAAAQEAQLEEITALNDELREMQAVAEKANNSKTVFLNNMSHDIRTPMNAILGFTELMEKRKDDPEQVADYIGKIKLSGEYLLSIINNILDMSKIESGKMTVEESVMDLLEAEDEARFTALDMAKEKRQIFTIHNTIRHRYVLCDVAKQKEIMMNLLSNAIKYTPEGGAIQMYMDELPCEREGYGTYRLTVSDNGIGMSKEFRQVLFDSFTRERNTTESKVVGTGLGMAIVKKLVDFLGGTITVDSEPGKGSTFIVTMEHRFAEKPEKCAGSAASMAVNSKSLEGNRILLAEDNDLNAEIVISVLADVGLQVDRAKDGVECIDMLLKSTDNYYELILMDIQMPNLNGYDTTKRIRNLDDPLRNSIPIIALTANAFEEDKQLAMEAGMNAHLSKPIEIPKLMTLLTGLLKKENDTDV